MASNNGINNQALNGFTSSGGAISIVSSSGSSVAISSGSGGLTLESAYVPMNIGSTSLNNGFPSEINIGRMNIIDLAAVDVNIGNSDSSTAVSIQGGQSCSMEAGAAVVTLNPSTGLALTSASTNMNISADAASTTVNIATGAGAKTITVGSTTAGSTLALNTPSSTYVIANQGYQLGTSGGPKILFGSGAPAGAQPKGSLYIRTGGTGGTQLLYVESDGAGTWLAFTAL